MRVVCACLLVFLLIGKSFSSENTWNFQAPFQKPLWSLGAVSAEKKGKLYYYTPIVPVEEYRKTKTETLWHK